MPCNDEVFHFRGEVMMGELNLLPVDVFSGDAKQFSTKVLQISVEHRSKACPNIILNLTAKLHPIHETTLPNTDKIKWKWNFRKMIVGSELVCRNPNAIYVNLIKMVCSERRHLNQTLKL